MNRDNDARPEVNLHDVLKERVESGKPIIVCGPSTQGIETTVARLSEDSAIPVRVIQVVDVDLRSVRDAGKADVEAVLANANVKIEPKS